MKKFLAYVASACIVLGTAIVSLKVGLVISEHFFDDADFPMIILTAAGSYIGYRLAIAFMKGVGFAEETQ